MKYFIDTEYQLASGTIGLISVGIISDDGREFYAEVAGARHWVTSSWIREHVLPHLQGGDVAMPGSDLTDKLRRFIGDDIPEFWGWCCGIDYAVLCALFGMDDWPMGWPYFFNDIAQSAREEGIVLEQIAVPFGRHHAMDDAREIKRLWEHLFPGGR